MTRADDRDVAPRQNTRHVSGMHSKLFAASSRWSGMNLQTRQGVQAPSDDHADLNGGIVVLGLLCSRLPICL